MTMKVKIKQVNAYEITIGNKTYMGFTKNDDWRGMISFTGLQGEIIVADNKKPFSNLFAEMFTDNNDELCEFDIIQLSPDLMPEGEKS